MASKLQIWNRAANAAGETRHIDSDADTAHVPSALGQIWDDLVREVMAAREWAWAKTQLPLTEISDQSIAYVGDGARSIFGVPYDIGDASQLTVTSNSIELALGTDYTFAATPGNPALVTFTTAPPLGAAITVTVATERIGWNHVWSLPSDCLRPLALLRDGVGVCWRPFGLPAHERHQPFAVVLNNSRTGYVLVTETDQFDALEYVALVAEPTAWPPHFVEALVRRLAAHLLNAVKKSPGEAQAMMQLYKAALSEAQAVANNSAGHPLIPETPALVARR